MIIERKKRENKNKMKSTSGLCCACDELILKRERESEERE